MFYEGDIFRPPAEHNSIILQVTVGCSHNKCGFCGLYKAKKFRIKSDEEISRDIDFASRMDKNVKRIFLCDGDALIIPQKKLIGILKELNTRLPWVTRVGVYGNAKSISKKRIEDLQELKKNKLGIIYMGLESGDDEILKKMNKGADKNMQIKEGIKVKNAGMKLSCTVLLGIGGKERTREHAVNTGAALTKLNPNYASALSLMYVRGTPLFDMIQNKKFEPISPIEILKELKLMIENTTLLQGIFSANHASNYLPIQFRMPGGKENAINLLNKALAGEIALKPDSLRAI